MTWPRYGRSVLSWSCTFSKFWDTVKDYDEFDIGVKNAILKASSSVASLISHIGDQAVFICSGTIIECEEQDGSFFGTVLTSATLLGGPMGGTSVSDDLEIDVYLSDGKLYEGQVLAYDFHHNIAIIKIKSIAPLSTATIRFIDDSMAIGSTESPAMGWRLSRHEDAKPASSRFKLCPGDLVIALGRYFMETYEIMGSPGIFSVYDCRCDTKELFMTSCTVTKLAVGGPLINCYGEVIGINFFACRYNAFLPINVAFKCLEALKKNGQAPRPWLGVRFANLYTADLEKLEKLKQKFPHVVKGVIVEEKEQNYVASLAVGDVIIGCDGQSVGSHLEFSEALWNKEGKSVELIVLRPSVGEQLKLTVMIETSPHVNRWFVPENSGRNMVDFPYHF